MAELVIDARERKLIKLFGSDARVETLDVGDVMCTYADGSGWVAERKTAKDLAKSIVDGRWAEQKDLEGVATPPWVLNWGVKNRDAHEDDDIPFDDRLFKSGFTVLFIVEGALQEAPAMRESLLGALVKAEVLERAHVFRTWDINESKQLLEYLREKMRSSCHVPTDTLAACKRKKDSSVENIWIRQLACIPGFSEQIARAITEHFGSLRGLEEALRADAFPDVPIHPSGRLLGKARIEKLREVFA